jgi:hypothetical protein
MLAFQQRLSTMKRTKAFTSNLKRTKTIGDVDETNSFNE